MVLKKCLEKLGIDLDWAYYLRFYFKKYGITEEADIKMFLAQTSHESNNYKRLEESFKYTPQRLLEVFPKRVKSLEEAQKLCKAGHKAIGDFVYGGRLGNKKDEGYKYRGRGIIQLTGKNNYSKYSELTGLDLLNNPELLLTKAGAVEVACCYYKTCGLIGVKDIKVATKKINGGYNGLEDRIKRFNKIKEL